MHYTSHNDCWEAIFVPTRSARILRWLTGHAKQQQNEQTRSLWRGSKTKKCSLRTKLGLKLILSSHNYSLNLRWFMALWVFGLTALKLRKVECSIFRDAQTPANKEGHCAIVRDAMEQIASQNYLISHYSDGTKTHFSETDIKVKSKNYFIKKTLRISISNMKATQNFQNKLLQILKNQCQN